MFMQIGRDPSEGYPSVVTEFLSDVETKCCTLELAKSLRALVTEL